MLHRWRRDTIHRAPLSGRPSAVILMASFSGICAAAVMRRIPVPSSFSRILRAEQALAQRRQLQPHTLYSATPSGTAHFHLHAVGDGLNLHADGCRFAVNPGLSAVPEDGSVISRSTSAIRVWLLPPAPTGVLCGARSSSQISMTSPGMAKPFGTHAEVHGLRFQQFCFNQPARRLLLPRQAWPRHPSS
ncbi:hypothetical protein KCP78_23800 [Salmonella enterica subsp. enterica]|nr:hypothetical protein KCP78_23800 [Salmonella enterica subsp. enterica]